MCEKIKQFLTMNNVVLVVALALAGSWAVGAISVLDHNYNLQSQVNQANLDNQITQLQNQNLQLQQAYYQTNEFLDLQARALLNKASPGEHLVILPASVATTTPTAPAETTATKSNINQWMDFLFGQH